MPLKVGELAKLTGVSVRTLHHYEAIGLLKPAMRSEGGHRCYTQAEIERLQSIVSLRELGFSLEDIGRCLDTPAYTLASIVNLHLARLAEQITRQQQLHQRLARLNERLQRGETIPSTQLLETMEAITMIEKYLTPEQIQVVQARREESDTPIEDFKANVAELRTLRAAGLPPSAPEVQAVARRHRGASAPLAAEGAALAEGLQRMLVNEPELRERLGLDLELLAYLEAALAALG